MKAIEAKLQQQTLELMNRAKVIEELKVSLSIFIDKYNELKKSIDKGKYSSFNLSNVMVNKSSSFSKLIVDKFYMQINSKKSSNTVIANINTSKSTKIVKPPSIKPEDDLDKFQENYSFMLEQNKLKDNLLITKQNEINNLKDDVDTYANEKESLKHECDAKQLKIKNLNEKINLNLLENETLTSSISKLSEENKKLTKEKEENCINNEKEINSLNIYRKEFENKIKALKEENDKKDDSIKILENKIKQLQEEINLNNKNNICDINEKNNLIKNLMFEKENLNKELVDKVNNFKEKENLNKELIDKVNHFKDKENLNKELLDKINLFKEKEILNKELLDKVNIFKEKEKIYLKNITFLKDSLVSLYEKTNKNFIIFEKKYNEKIAKMNQIVKNISNLTVELFNKFKTNFHNLKNSVNETLVKNSVQSESNKIETQYKQIIEKLELEKTKLIYQIQNLERYVKENQISKKNSQINANQNTQNDQNVTNISILNTKVDWLQKEYNKFIQISEPKFKEEVQKEKENSKILKKKVYDLETKLSQYKIENAGQSKIIDERNEEIIILKQELFKIS